MITAIPLTWIGAVNFQKISHCSPKTSPCISRVSSLPEIKMKLQLTIGILEEQDTTQELKVWVLPASPYKTKLKYKIMDLIWTRIGTQNTMS